MSVVHLYSNSGRRTAGGTKCLLCGAISEYNTADGWRPDTRAHDLTGSRSWCVPDHPTILLAEIHRS